MCATAVAHVQTRPGIVQVKIGHQTPGPQIPVAAAHRADPDGVEAVVDVDVVIGGDSQCQCGRGHIADAQERVGADADGCGLRSGVRDGVRDVQTVVDQGIADPGVQLKGGVPVLRKDLRPRGPHTNLCAPAAGTR